MATRSRPLAADAARGVRSFLSQSKRLAAILFAVTLATSACAGQWTYKDVRRTVALSDIHGAYDAFVETLQAAEVIDASLKWRGGDTHLVITGDLLDRGPDSRKVMDLVMRLELEALQAGGQVHQLLGNHEVMNLIGDLRYVADEEFASYIDLESSDEREYWLQHYLRNRSDDTDELTAREQFEKLAPPGYFGHRRAFRADAKYGKWLLERPIAVVINETLFVHGGVPAMFSEFGLDGTNSRLKDDLRGYVDARRLLEDNGDLSPITGFRVMPDVVRQRLSSGQLDAGSEDSARQLLVLSESPLHNSAGPTWYRGSALCSPIIEADRLQDALKSVGAARVVVGHTPTIARSVRQRLNGRVFEIDTGMLSSHYGGVGHALILKDGDAEVVSQNGTRATGVVDDLRQVGFESPSMSEADLERILTEAQVSSVSAASPTWKIVSIDDNGRSFYAKFSATTPVNGHLPEVAAYRLDRLLGLEMVPVTVPREIAGEIGSLQFLPVETLNEMERVTSESGDSAHCQLDRQHSAMIVFDALINNTARSPSSMLYQIGEWELMLTDHNNSFGVDGGSLTSTSLSKLNIGNYWRYVLTEVNAQTIAAELGDVLSDKQIEALVERGRLLRESAGE